MNAPNTTAMTRPQSIADLGKILGGKMQQIKSVIASNLTPEKMARIALNELRNSDYLTKIALSNPDSFVNAVVQASHLGLEIGGTLGQAYLVPFKCEIKMMPGYRGLLSLARRSGEITSINAEIVFANDEFDLSLGIENNVTHKPKLDGERGEPRLAYMVAHFKDGGHHFEWMSIDEIMKVKERSSAVQSGKKTPWDTDRDEMIRKTVIRRGWKYLPMSIEMQTAAAIESANELNRTVTIEGDAVIVKEEGAAEDTPVTYYPADAFAAELPKWQKIVTAKKRTVEEIITIASTKATLTDAQVAAIKALSATPINGDVMTAEEIAAARQREINEAKGV